MNEEKFKPPANPIKWKVKFVDNKGGMFLDIVVAQTAYEAWQAVDGYKKPFSECEVRKV